MVTRWESRMVDWLADTMDSSLGYLWDNKKDSQMVSWWADYLVRRLGLGWIILMDWMKESLSGYLWVEWKDY